MENEDGADGKGARGRRSEFEGSPRRRGSHLSGFSRTRDPYPISFPRQFPSVNSIIYRYTPHPRSSTSAALLPSPLRLSSGSSSSSSSSSSFSSSSRISTRYSTRSKQEPGTIMPWRISKPRGADRRCKRGARFERGYCVCARARAHKGADDTVANGALRAIAER